MTTPAVIARASALIDLGRPTEAIPLLSAALSGEPDSAALLRQLARAQLVAKQPGPARVTASRAVAAAPDDEWSYRILSQACSDLDDHRDAVAAAAEAQRLAPMEWRTHVRMTFAATQAHELHRAWDAARESVRLAPDESDTHFAMGYAAMAVGDAATAERAYRTALAIRPDHASAANNLGLVQMKQRGGLNKALRGFGSALAMDAQLDSARRNLAVVARRYMRRFHIAVVLAFLILTASFTHRRTPGPSGAVDNTVSTASRLHAGLVGGVALLALLASIAVFDSRLPRNLRPYYRRLPRTDRVLGVWLLLDLAALLTICAMAVPTTYSGRSELSSLAWVLILAALVVSWSPRLFRRRRARR